MSVRPATPSDLPAVTHIQQTCLNENGRSKFLYPHRHKYPEDYAASLHDQARKKLLLEDPKIAHNIVLVTPQNEIVGWAMWRRMLLSTGLKHAEGRSPSSLLGDNNRASSPDRTKRCLDAVEIDKALYFNVDHWYLSMLAVLPTHRRHGYGKLLCLWGMKRAREDNVPCMLTSSEDGEKLYRYLGWKRIGFRTPPSLEGLDEEAVKKDVGEDSDMFVPLPVMKWGEDGEGYDRLEEMEGVVKAEGGGGQES